MALGDKLRKARTAKGVTLSDAAAATHMKMQVADALEREDFSRMPAPIYAKGFIRMYAEYLGLDPNPLIEEYLDQSGGPSKSKGSLIVSGEASQRRPVPRPPPTRKPKAPAVTPAPLAPVPPPAAPAPEPAPLPETPPAPPPAASPPRRRPDVEPIDLFADPESLAPEAGAAAGQDAPPPPEPDRESEARELRPEPRRDLTGDLARGAASMLQDGREFVEEKSGDAREWMRGWKLDLSWFQFVRSPLRLLSVIVAILVLLIFIVSSLSRCSHRGGGPISGLPGKASDELALVADPPDVYLD